jgi:tetratricopeptide (TPR) repeat protein
MRINNRLCPRQTREGLLSAGTRVKRARLKKGLTQSELAGDEYSAAYVSIIESGKREPSERVLKAFARTLGMTYEELATGRPPDAEALLGEEMMSARRSLSKGETAEALKSFRRIGKRAGSYGLDRLRDSAAVAEAYCHEVAGKFDAALPMYEDLLGSIPEAHIVAKSDAVAGRARCVRVLGDVPYSTHILESHLSHLRRSGLEDPDALARIYMTLVASYFEAGLLKQAGATAEKALQLAPRVTDLERVAGMHVNVARVLLHRGDYDAAARSFSSAEEAYAELGLPNEQGVAFLSRAFLRKAQQRYDDARNDLDHALRVFEETGNEVNKARTLSELGGLERLMGHADQAVFILERAARMAVKNEPGSAAVSYRELALCHLELGEPAKVKSSFKKAIELLETSGDNYELAITYRAWGDALRDDKDYQKACDAYRSAAVALEAA